MKILTVAAVFGLVAIPIALSRSDIACPATPASFDSGQRVGSADGNRNPTPGPMDKKKSSLRRYAQVDHQERPFGGPMPPKKRSLEPPRSAGTCKTPTTVCKLQKAQPIGATCSCPESDGKPIPGVVVDPSS